MDISVKNLGPLKKGTISINGLTMIFGDNNKGKTYLSYAVYGLYKFLQDESRISIKKEWAIDLIENGTLCIPFGEIEDLYLDSIIENSKKYSRTLRNVFSAPSAILKDGDVSIVSPKEGITVFEQKTSNVSTQSQKSVMPKRIRLGSKTEFEINLTDNEKQIEINITSESKQDIPMAMINNIVGELIGRYLSTLYFERGFAVTSERTGIALFYKDLDINRNQIIDLITKNPTKNMNNLVFGMTSRYALPIKDNIEVIRDYGELIKKNSFITANTNSEYVAFLKKWTQFIGGDYVDSNGTTMFFTNNQTIPLHITSSAIKSLFLLDIYIKHYAQPHDILFIDEPELNLHPGNQIKLIRLLLELANFGIKLVITTHSDYIIREVNIAIMEKKKCSNILDSIKLENINAYFISDENQIEELARDENGCFSVALLDSVITQQNDEYDKLLYEETEYA
jgi:hypothetical protein